MLFILKKKKDNSSSKYHWLAVLVLTKAEKIVMKIGWRVDHNYVGLDRCVGQAHVGIIRLPFDRSNFCWVTWLQATHPDWNF